MRKPFNFLQAAILKALTEALFHGVDIKITSDQVVANLQHQFAMVEGGKPKELGLTLYLLCLVLGGPAFLLMGPHWRSRRVKKRLMRSTNNLLQDLARIRGVVYAGYYGHWIGTDETENDANPVLNAIRFELPHRRSRGAGEVPIAPFLGRDLGQSDILAPGGAPAVTEIIVIGSGAGGAVAAANLAQHYDVLVIEAGAHFLSDAITHEERRMTARLFVDGGIQTSRDRDIVLFQGRCIGGSTVINNGIAFRVAQAGLTHPQANDVFATWEALGAAVERTRFDDAYHAVERRLGIEEIDPKSGRQNGTHLLSGWAAHAATSADPMDQAAPALWFNKNYGPRSIHADCAYCGYCNTGCRYGRKQGMAQSFLIDARAFGAHILAETTVERILWGAPAIDGCRVATGVEVSYPDGSRHEIRATKGVVVAAGTMASSRILDRSGIAGTGEGISLNIACPVVALMPHAMRSWDEDQMATYVDRGDFLLESHFQPPMSMSTLMPGWFGDHAARMLNYTRLASAGILFPADRQGRLIGGALHLKLRAEVELPLIRRALATLTRVHFAGGALEVYPALARGQTLRRGEDVDAFFESAIREADDVTLSSSHPQGGNARNRSPEKGVVDLDCRVHGTANVLVTDASTFSSCIRVNAQLTTMAMAQYATADAPFG